MRGLFISNDTIVVTCRIFVDFYSGEAMHWNWAPIVDNHILGPKIALGLDRDFPKLWSTYYNLTTIF